MMTQHASHATSGFDPRPSRSADATRPGARHTWRMWLRHALVILAIGLFLALPSTTSADPGDVGYEGPLGTGAGAAPSGSKPQAKLWFNDGIWWASMWDVSTSDFYIWRLDRTSETWSRTNTRARRPLVHPCRRAVGWHQAVCRVPRVQRIRWQRHVPPLPLQLQQLDRHLQPGHRVPRDHQQRQVGDLGHRQGLDRQAVGDLGAGHPGLGQPDHGQRHDVGHALRAPGLDERQLRRRLDAHPLRRQQDRGDVEQPERVA